MPGNRIMTPEPVIGSEGRTNSSMLRKRLAHAPRIRITYGNTGPLLAEGKTKDQYPELIIVPAGNCGPVSSGKAKDQHPELIIVPAGNWRCAPLSPGKEKIQ